MDLPSISSYSENTDQANCMRVEVGSMVIWYSYKTPVAFTKGYGPKVVRQNDWAQTTGKHLNWIDGGDKKSRIPGKEFERLLQEALV